MRDGYAAGIDRGRIAATAASCSVALLRRDDMEAARAAWQEDLAKDRRPGRGGSRRRSNPHGGPRVAARLGLALRFDAFGPGPASAQRCDRRATRQRGRPTRSVPGATLVESNRARYDRPPQLWRDVANLRICPSASRSTCCIRNANGFLGRCDSVSLSRLLTRRAFAKGSACGATIHKGRNASSGLCSFWPVDRASRCCP